MTTPPSYYRKQMASQRSSAMGGGGGGSVGGYSGRPPVQGQYGGHGAAGSSSSSMGRGSGVAAVKARRGVAEGQGLGQGQRPGQGGTFLTGMDYADDELSDAELARQTRRRQQVGILLSTKPLSPPVLYLHMNHHYSHPSGPGIGRCQEPPTIHPYTALKNPLHPP